MPWEITLLFDLLIGFCNYFSVRLYKPLGDAKTMLRWESANLGMDYRVLSVISMSVIYLVQQSISFFEEWSAVITISIVVLIDTLGDS